MQSDSVSAGRPWRPVFRSTLHVRGLELRGITTDGSPLYPGPIAAIFPGVRHQVCEFHVIAEITKAVLHAVSKVRKQLAGQKTALGRGRPRTKEAKRAARRNARLQAKIGDLFEHRHLFVAHHLTAAERRTLQRITRGLPHLRTLREIMDEVYRLFDRRCRTDTALTKLAKLRKRVRQLWQGRQDSQQIVLAQSGKGVDLPGRLVASGDLQCGRAQAIAVTARCKRPFTVSAPSNIFMLALPPICLR